MNRWPLKITSFLVILFCLLANGCSYLGVVSYPTIIQKKKHMLAGGNFNRAFKSLDQGARFGNAQVLNLLEQGTIRHIQGDYPSSIKSFEQALSRIQKFEDRAVISARSLASQLLTLPLNDNAIPYYGYPFERVLANTYQAMNYLFLGDPEGARVEVRQADQRQTKELKRHNKEISEYQKWGRKRKIDLADYPQVQKLRKKMRSLSGSTLNSFQNAFTYYLSGIIYELNGEENDAYIDYKKTYRLSPDFTYVQADLLRLAKKLGFRGEYAEWVSRFKNQKKQAGKTGCGAELIVFYEDGFISQKQQIKLTIPIHKNLVNIALPVYTQKGKNKFLVQAIDNGKQIGTSSQVVNLDNLAIKALDEQLPIILIRQIARVISKTTVSRQLQNNSVAFLATSLYNILSENADLRNWLLLPNNIQILRSRVAAGKHEFVWRLQSRFGQVQSREETSVTLQDADVCLVNIRSIEDRLFISSKVLHRR